MKSSPWDDDDNDVESVGDGDNTESCIFPAIIEDAGETETAVDQDENGSRDSSAAPNNSNPVPSARRPGTREHFKAFFRIWGIVDFVLPFDHQVREQTIELPSDFSFLLLQS